MSLNIIVNGASGRMGSETVKAIEAESDLNLVAKLGPEDNLKQSIIDAKANSVIDFTNAASAFENTKTIIEAGAHPIIGTSGFMQEQVDELNLLCQEKKLGGVIAPNFSIGAVLMMKYASEAAQYFQHVEIIEKHHDQKQDAPSGTAVRTAEMIAKANNQLIAANTEKETLAHARGANFENIHIHAIRLPGYVAHQEVIFGSTGETFTLKHDSTHRNSFMPGVVLACRKVSELNHLVYGLEHIL